MSVEWWLLCAPAPRAPESLTVWVCQSCGHWTANSYMEPDPKNPGWQPRCKMKDGCTRPYMVPFTYERGYAGRPVSTDAA